MQRFAFALEVVATALAAVPCISLSLLAQPSPTVTEAEFLSALVEDHPALVVRREAVAIAEAEARRVGTLSNPVFRATREDPSGPADQIDLTLSWQLPQPSRGPAVASRERRLAAAEARFAYHRLELRLAMREAYAAWAVASELTGRLGVRLRTVSDLAQRQRRRAQSGESSGLEASRLALAAAELESQQALLESEALDASAIARGWNPAISLASRPSLPTLPPVPVSLAEGHPTLTALGEEVDAARLATRAQARYVDLPELVAGWQRVEAGPESFAGPILGVSWQLPLTDRNQPGRVLAEARLEAATARRDAVRRRIDAERAGAVAAYERLVTATVAARAANAANEQMVAATMAAFQAGETSLTDLLDTVRSVLAAESTSLRLHGAALEAHRRLERLAGRPLDLQ